MEQEWKTMTTSEIHWYRQNQKNVTSDVNTRDDKEIGRFDVGKNSYLGLSKSSLCSSTVAPTQREANVE